MAQLTSVDIQIEDIIIRQFSSLSLSQGIFEHHAFRLVCPADAIDGTSGSIFNTSGNLIGGSFLLKITAVNAPGSLQFKGVVTQVESARHSGHAGDIVISGYSPTILQDNGPHCKIWEKKSVKNIAEDVLMHFPQNLLRPQITPLFDEILSYTVQYKETAWQFLNRLSATYGEWLFYDGQQLILGTPKGDEVNLTYGSNLTSFNMSLQIRPTKFQMVAYDYINSEVYDCTPKSITAGKAGLHDLSTYALQKASNFFGTQPKQWHNQFLTNKKQLDDFANARAGMQSSNMVRFNGSSGHTGIQVGGSVNVRGKNIFSEADESFGEYRVISVNHHCDGEGNYANDFVAIPASVKYPPVTYYIEPRCETQSAFVTDNHDVKGLGRIRVKFHWMKGSEKSPWLRVTSPHGGGGKGFFFIPEIGEEVIVGFEGDSPTKAYIIGTVFNGKAKNESGNNGNDVKLIQTRSGNKIVMNDKGSIIIGDPSGNELIMHGNGEMSIQAPNMLKITSSDILISAGNSIQIGAGSSKDSPAPTVSIEMQNGDKSAMIWAMQTLNLSSDKDMVIDSTKTLNVNGGAKANISSADTDII